MARQAKRQGEARRDTLGAEERINHLPTPTARSSAHHFHVASHSRSTEQAQSGRSGRFPQKKKKKKTCKGNNTEEPPKGPYLQRLNGGDMPGDGSSGRQWSTIVKAASCHLLASVGNAHSSAISEGSYSNPSRGRVSLRLHEPSPRSYPRSSSGVLRMDRRLNGKRPIL
jgi:hypothetical protein